MVTSLWGSGEIGPLCIVVPQGFISDSEVEDIRCKFGNDIFVLCTHRHSHFMTADTVVEYYNEVLAPSFHRRRAELAERYQRSFESEWGYILCDGFTGHHATNAGTDLLRA